jgi:hypothetical protein
MNDRREIGDAVFMPEPPAKIVLVVLLVLVLEEMPTPTTSARTRTKRAVHQFRSFSSLGVPHGGMRSSPENPLQWRHSMSSPE